MKVELYNSKRLPKFKKVKILVFDGKTGTKDFVSIGSKNSPSPRDILSN